MWACGNWPRRSRYCTNNTLQQFQGQVKAGPSPTCSESWGQRAVCKSEGGVKATGLTNHMGGSHWQKGYMAGGPHGELSHSSWCSVGSVGRADCELMIKGLHYVRAVHLPWPVLIHFIQSVCHLISSIWARLKPQYVPCRPDIVLL